MLQSEQNKEIHVIPIIKGENIAVRERSEDMSCSNLIEAMYVQAGQCLYGCLEACRS